MLNVFTTDYPQNYAGIIDAWEPIASSGELMTVCINIILNHSQLIRFGAEV